MLGLLSLLLEECLFFLGYVSTSQQYPPPLTRGEEARLLERMAAGEEEARRELILHNLRLVAHIARKYTVPGCTGEDLTSIGTVGLIKAVNSYRQGSGTALGTYAARCIENEILMTLRASRKRQGDVSLSETIGADGEGNDMTFLDVLGTDAQELEETVIRRVTLERIRQLLGALPSRERVVLEMRYGMLDGRMHPQHEVAKRLGISRSYVSRVEKRALAFMRAALEGGEPGKEM